MGRSACSLPEEGGLLLPPSFELTNTPQVDSQIDSRQTRSLNHKLQLPRLLWLALIDLQPLVPIRDQPGVGPILPLSVPRLPIHERGRPVLGVALSQTSLHEQVVGVVRVLRV